MRRVCDNRPGRGPYGRAAAAACTAAAVWFLPVTPALAAATPAATEPPAAAPPAPTAAPAPVEQAAPAPAPAAVPVDPSARPAPGARHSAGRGGARTPAGPSAAVPATDADPAPATERGPGLTTEPGADLAVSGVLRPAVSGPRDHREGAGPAGRETFDYIVTVTNRGPSTARQVRVTDRLPASLEFVSSRDGCTASGTTAVCGPLATLAPGGTHAWMITVRLAPGYEGDGSDIVNEAVVDAATPDPDARNNTASLTGLDVPPDVRTADLSLRKTAVLARGREHVRPGETFSYLISVHNHGPGTARRVEVTDRLPASLTLLSSPDGCATAPGADRMVVCPPRERLAAGATAEFRITVRASAADRANPPARMCTPIENVARVTSATFDPDLSDNANAPDTTGPDGGRLCLVSDGDEGHHGGDDGDGDHGRDDQHGDHDDHGRDDQQGNHDHQGREDHHGGRGDLADSGAKVPPGLLWAAGALVAGGAGLRTAFRARPRA
ncbi:DUF11 domain-containing protein [Streptomyces sp. NPDC006529]|uniref:DUF11 domain-containing protein n=1 Tax=Streptomyces sp. NPDC006529 TaxID=3157177 RepID=UPI0033B78613